MRKIKATIEIGTDGEYGVYCVEEPFTGMGETIEKAKNDMYEQIKMYKDYAIEKGMKYPSFLDEEYEFEYSFDYISLLEYYVANGYLTLAGFSKLSGVNQKQLWAYLHGTKPRKEQVKKIENGFLRLNNSLNKSLNSASAVV